MKKKNMKRRNIIQRREKQKCRDRKRRNIERAIKLKEHQEEEQENRIHTIARNR
jgi:hypothetical protein